MTPITESMPLDNAMCRVTVIPEIRERAGAYRFVRCSDGDHFWDNLVDEILQANEVTHWTPVQTGHAQSD